MTDFLIKLLRLHSKIQNILQSLLEIIFITPAFIIYSFVFFLIIASPIYLIIFLVVTVGEPLPFESNKKPLFFCCIALLITFNSKKIMSIFSNSMERYSNNFAEPKSKKIVYIINCGINFTLILSIRAVISSLKYLAASSDSLYWKLKNLNDVLAIHSVVGLQNIQSISNQATTTPRAIAIRRPQRVNPLYNLSIPESTVAHQIGAPLEAVPNFHYPLIATSNRP